MADAKGSGWLDDCIPYRVYRITNRLNAKLQNRVRALHINLSQWRVLSVVHSHGSLNISEIVDAALMEQPTVSRVVAQLEKDGFISRRASEADSRVSEITITTQGEAAVRQIRPAAIAHEEMALRDLKPKELEQLRSILSKIESNIDLYE